MEIEEGVIRRGRNTLRDLQNSSYGTKAEFNIIPSLKTKLKHVYLHRC